MAWNSTNIWNSPTRSTCKCEIKRCPFEDCQQIFETPSHIKDDVCRSCRTRPDFVTLAMMNRAARLPPPTRADWNDHMRTYHFNPASSPDEGPSYYAGFLNWLNTQRQMDDHPCTACRNSWRVSPNPYARPLHPGDQSCIICGTDRYSLVAIGDRRPHFIDSHYCTSCKIDQYRAYLPRPTPRAVAAPVTDGPSMNLSIPTFDFGVDSRPSGAKRSVKFCRWSIVMAQVLKMLYRPHRQVEEFKQMKEREEKLDGRVLAKWDFASGDELAEEEEEEEEEDDDEDDEDEAEDEAEQDEEDEISGNVSGS